MFRTYYLLTFLLFFSALSSFGEPKFGFLEKLLDTIGAQISSGTVATVDQALEVIRRVGTSRHDSRYTMAGVYQSGQSLLFASPEFPRIIGNDGGFTFSVPTAMQGYQRIELIQADLRQGHNWASIEQIENKMSAVHRPAMCLGCHGAKVPVQDRNGVIKMVTVFRPLIDGGGRWVGWFGSDDDESRIQNGREMEYMRALIDKGPARLKMFQGGFHPRGAWNDIIAIAGSLRDRHEKFMLRLLISHPDFGKYRSVLTLALFTHEQELPFAEILKTLPENLQNKWHSRVRKFSQDTHAAVVARDKKQAENFHPDDPQKYRTDAREEEGEDNYFGVTRWRDNYALLAVIAEELGFRFSEFHCDPSRGDVFVSRHELKGIYFEALKDIFPEVKKLAPYPSLQYAKKLNSTQLSEYKPITVESLWQSEEPTDCRDALAAQDSKKQTPEH